MPFLALARAASILVVTAVSASCQPATFDIIYFCFLIPHAVLAFVYSKRRVLETLSQPRSAVRLTGLMATALAVSQLQWPPLDVYFGVHNGLTDAYVAGYVGPRADGGPLLRRSRLAFNLCLFFVILRDTAPSVPLAPRVGALLASAAATAWALARARGRIDARQWLGYAGFEALGAGVAVISFWRPLRFNHIALYHLILWLIMPLPHYGRVGAGKVLSFLGLNAAATTALLLISPLAGIPFALAPRTLLQQAFFWGYVHVTASFALSSLNPALVRRFFDPPALAPGRAPG